MCRQKGTHAIITQYNFKPGLAVQLFVFLWLTHMFFDVLVVCTCSYHPFGHRMTPSSEGICSHQYRHLKMSIIYGSATWRRFSVWSLSLYCYISTFTLLLHIHPAINPGATHRTRRRQSVVGTSRISRGKLVWRAWQSVTCHTWQQIPSSKLYRLQPWWEGHQSWHWAVSHAANKYHYCDVCC